jgi:MinD superfamily P-loop ATPase
MKQLAVISGKGGTGKTSLVAAFAQLAHPAVSVDCDVDAADLHLLLRPTETDSSAFEGGLTAEIDQDRCVQCGLCTAMCRFDAIDADFKVDPFLCEGCGVCHDQCPEQCITLTRETAGHWHIGNSRFGPFVNAKLGIAQENSGKLVAHIRKLAAEQAEKNGLDLMIIDGSPGIGCPVISSITGADLVLIVTEPTPSGLHDLMRVLSLTEHFSIPAAICINKYDLNRSMTEKIKQAAREKGAEYVGRIRFDPEITHAMVAEKTLIEWDKGPARNCVKSVWGRVSKLLGDKRDTTNSSERDEQ